MSDTAEEKSRKVRTGPPRRPETYHGVRLLPAQGTPRFSVEEMRQAVEMAIAKNRHLFTPYK